MTAFVLRFCLCIFVFFIGVDGLNSDEKVVVMDEKCKSNAENCKGEQNKKQKHYKMIRKENFLLLF